MATEKLIGADDVSFDDDIGANYISTIRFQATATGKVTEFRLKADGNANVKVAIYADNAGEPGDRLAKNDTGQAVVDGWNTLTLEANLDITSGTYYWLAINSDAAHVGCHTTTGVLRYKAATYAGFTWPDPAGTGYGSATTLYGILAGWGTPPLQTLLPSAIASAEAFGTAKLNLKLFPSAIASLEAFGSPTVILVGTYIYPTGIASQEAFGNPTVLPGAVIIQPSAIQSAEALGSPQLNLKLFAQSIPTAEAFGTPLVIPGAVIIQPSGIASLEAFGTPLVFYDQVIIPTGIASAEAFGTPTVSFILLIQPKSIPSAEAFGTLKVLREIIHIILDGQYTLGSPGVNRIYVIGKDAEGNPVYGSSLNQAEIDLVGERLDFNQDLSIPTTAKAADVAAAAVAKARLTGSRGFIVIPPTVARRSGPWYR